MMKKLLLLSVVFMAGTALTTAQDYPSIGVLGGSTITGWDMDTDMTTADGTTYILQNVVIAAPTDSTVSPGVKFRQDDAWTINWGGTGFPSGNATQNGDNIPAPDGTYDITFNRLTGDYTFSLPASAGVNEAEAVRVTIFPNPTQNTWTFNANNAISTISITDITGKTVVSKAMNSTLATVDASGLASGVYFAKVATQGAVQTIKVIKN